LDNHFCKQKNKKTYKAVHGAKKKNETQKILEFVNPSSKRLATRHAASIFGSYFPIPS